MANQFFSNINTPEINRATLKRVMSSAVKDNIFQEIIVRPGEGVIEKFSNDTAAAEIQVVRVRPDNDEAREIGADINGGWFNADAASNPETAAYGIRIIDMIDKCKDIPASEQDMIAVDLAEATLKNLTGKVARGVNAVSVGAMLTKNFNDVASGKVAKNWVTISDNNYKDAIITAGVQLDSGNEEEGIDAYPDTGRAVYLRPEAKRHLLTTGQIIVGGSNYAQDILRQGGVDAETRPSVVSTGYIGEISNMPCYVLSPVIWAAVERYMGLGAGALSGVLGVVVSGIGTGRALAFNAAIKTIDSPNGQGIRIQPKYRFGAECWDALSVVPIVASAFANPATAAAPLTMKAPGSRKTTATPTITTAAGGKFTITGASGASFYYTDDGTVPTVNSTKYTAQVTLTKSATVKAIAVKAGELTSLVASETVTVA